MNEIASTPPGGLLALVSYIPDPLGSFLQDLRGHLPGMSNPEPHITLLPRRPLLQAAIPHAPPPVDSASERALSILGGFTAFEVELSSVHHFAGTNVLYLDISDGSSRLHDLHRALNSGELAHDEEFEFRPHLTLAGPLPDAEVEAAEKRAQAAWSAAPCEKRFLLENVVCLWMSPAGAAGEWRRLWSHRLAAATARAASATVRNRTS